MSMSGESVSHAAVVALAGLRKTEVSFVILSAWGELNIEMSERM